MKLHRPLANDLDAYRDEVRHAIAARTGRAVLNGSPEHAAVLLQESLRASQSEMLILSNRLDEICFGRADVRHAAQVFLADPRKKISVLVETALWDPQPDKYRWGQSPFVKSLRQFAPAGQFSMRTVRKEWAQGYKFNFFVADDFGIRYQEDRDEPSAVAGFFSDQREKSGSDPVLHLRKIFHDLWRSADDVDLSDSDEIKDRSSERDEAACIPPG